MTIKNILYNAGKYLIVEPFKFVTGYYLPRLQRLRKINEEFEDELEKINAESKSLKSTDRILEARVKEEKERGDHLRNLSLKSNQN